MFICMEDFINAAIFCITYDWISDIFYVCM